MTPAEYITRLEDDLCCAVCAIRNGAGVAEITGRSTDAATLRRWADELVTESGIDFDVVLARVKDPE